MLQLSFVVTIEGKVVERGTERFRDARQAIHTLKLRHVGSLPAELDGQWDAVEVTLK